MLARALAVVRVSAAAVIAGVRAVAGGVLQGQDGRALHRLQRRRRLRPLCAHGRAPSRPAHSRQSAGRAEEHGRRGRPAARQLALQAAPRDGTVIGATSRNIAFEPLIGNKAAQYDSSQFTWLGSANDEVSVCASWHTSGVATINDVLAQGARHRLERHRRRHLSVSAPDQQHARHEVQDRHRLSRQQRCERRAGARRGRRAAAAGRGRAPSRRGRHGSTEKKINVLIQLSLTKHPDLPDVPLIMDLARDDEQRQMFRLIFARQVMGRPFQSTPGVPADRLQALQKAFMDTMKDPAFLAEADKLKFEITPVSGRRYRDAGGGHPQDAAGAGGARRRAAEVTHVPQPRLGRIATRADRHAARRRVDGAVFRAHAGRRH